MSRLVKKTAHGPQQVGEYHVCMCGLSESQPFCDGSHVKTMSESDKKIYWYGNEKQEEVGEEGCQDCENCTCGHKDHEEKTKKNPKSK